MALEAINEGGRCVFSFGGMSLTDHESRVRAAYSYARREAELCGINPAHCWILILGQTGKHSQKEYFKTIQESI
jgi:hypothetical protein